MTSTALCAPPEAASDILTWLESTASQRRRSGRQPNADIEIGQSAQIERTLTRDDIALFSKASGDFNPTHVDDAFARSKGAEGVTAHSLWSTSLVSSLLGNVLPGPGTVYQKQDIAFQRPVVIGDTVTARIKAREKRDNNVVLFDCEVVNQRNEPVMTGLAEVVAPAEKIRIAKTDLPDVTVRHHDSYRELFEVLQGLDPIPAALIHPCDYVSLKGAVDAAESGFIQPVLVGPEHRMRAIAEEHEIDIDLYRIEDPEELEYLALRDLFDARTVLLIEWPERGAGHLPDADLTLEFGENESGRYIACRGTSDHGLAVARSVYSKT